MANQTNRIDVNLALNADISKASRELQNLKKQFDTLFSSIKSNEGFKGLNINTDQFYKASQSALELKRNLESAINVDTGKLDVSKLSSAFNKSGKSLKDYREQLALLGPEGVNTFNSLAKSIITAEVPLRQTSKLLDQFAITLKNTARWQISSSLLHGFIGSVETAYHYAEDLNRSLNNIRIVTGYNTEQMAQFANEANRAAQSLSTSTTAYTNAALIYYQQGLKGEDVTERVNTTIKLANVTRQSAEDVSQQMTAIWNNFVDGSQSLEHYADVITALGATTASSSAEIAEGLQKFAAVADTVGLSYDYATAALATVTATTRQSADIVGNAFKTLFSRLEGLKLGETLDDGTDLNKYSKALDAVGVSIKDTSGQLKTMDTILDELGNRWKTLGEDQKMALAQTVGGVRQYTQLIALMENYDFFKENVETARGAEGTLQKQAEIYAESWDAAKKRVQAALEDIYSQLVNDKFFIDLNNALANVIKLISGVVKGLGGMQGVFSALGMGIISLFRDSLGNTLNGFFTTQSQRLRQWGEEVDEAVKGLERGAFESGLDTTAGVYERIHSTYQALLQSAEELTAEQQEQVKLQLQFLHNQAKQVEQYELEAQIAQKTYSAKINEVTEKRDATRIATGKTLHNLGISSDSKIIKDFKEQAKVGQATKEQIQEIANKFKLEKEEAKQLTEALTNLIKVEKEYLEVTSKNPEIKQKEANKLAERVGKGAQKLQDSIEDIKGKPNATVSNVMTPIETKIETEEEKLKRIQKEIKNFDKSGETLIKFSQGLMSVSMAISTLKGLGDIWSNQDTSVGEKILSTVTSLSIALPMLITGFNALKASLVDLPATFTHLATMLGATVTKEALAVGVNTKLGASFAFLGKSVLTTEIHILGLGVALWKILAIIGAVIAIVTVLDTAWNADANAAKKAAQEAEGLSKAYKDTKQAYDDLKQSLENYNSAKKALDALTEGTQEWKDAVIELNEQVLNLLNKYPQLAQYINDTNGILTISEQGQEEFLKQQSKVVETTMRANLMGQSKKVSTQSTSDITDFSRSIYAGFDTNATKSAIEAINKNGTNILLNTETLAKVAEIEMYQANALLQHKDELIKLANEVKVNTQTEKVYAEQIGKSVTQQEKNTQVNALLGKSAQELYKNVYSSKYEDKTWFGNLIGAGIRDAEIQKQYAKAMGYQNLKDLGGNKGLYLVNGEEKEISDEVARAYLAQQAATEEAAKQAEQYTKALQDVTEKTGITSDAVLNVIAGIDTNIDNLTQAEINAIKNLDVSQLDSKTKNLLKLNSTDFKELKNNIVKNWDNAVKDIRNDLEFNDIKEAWDNLINEVGQDKIEKLTLASQKGLAETLKKSILYGSEEAQQLLEEVFQSKSTKKIEEFGKILNDIKWENTSVEEFKDILNQLGIVTKLDDEQLTNLVSKMNLVAKSANDLSETFAKNYSVAEKLFKNKNSTTIVSDKDFQGLDEEYRKYFMLMADGSHKLIIDAYEFYNIVKQNSIEEFKKSIDAGEKQLNAIYDYKNLGYDLTKATASTVSQLKKELESYQNKTGANILKRPIVNAEEMRKAGWTKDFDKDSSYATMYTNTFSNKEGTEYINFTPIITDENGNYKGVLSSEDLQRYAENVINGVTKDYLKLQIGTEFDTAEEATKVASKIHELHALIKTEQDKTTTNAGVSASIQAPSTAENINVSNFNDSKVIIDNDKITAQLDLIERLNKANDEQISKWRELNDEGKITIDQVTEIGNIIESINSSEITQLQRQTYEQLASTADNLKELHQIFDDYIAEDNTAAIQAFTKAAMAMDEATDETNLKPEEVKEYANYLQQAANSMDQLNDNMSDNEAEIVAKGIMKMNDAIDTIAKNWDDWSSIIKRSTDISEEYSKAMTGMQNAVAGLLDTSKDYVSSDFIIKHLDEIKEAATGSAEAIDNLKDELLEDIVMNLKLDNSKISNQELFDQLKSLQAQIPEMKVGISAELEKDGWVQSLQELLNTAGATVDQCNAIFDALGYEATYATEEKSVVQKVPRYITRDIITEGQTISGHKLVTTRTSSYQDGYDTFVGTMEVPAMATNGKGRPSQTPIIKSLTKKAGGSFNNYSSSNSGGTATPGGKSSGGGGGGGSEKEKEVKEHKEDETDRYWDINNAIKAVDNSLKHLAETQDELETKQSHYYGKALIKSLQNENKLLKEQDKLLQKQKGNYDALLKEQYKELGELKGKLQAAGGTFNGDQLTNYAAVMQKNLQDYNAAVDAYNASAQEDGDKKALEQAEKSYNKTKEILDKYKDLYYDKIEETKSKLAEINKQVLEIFYKQVANNFQAWEIKIQLKLDTTEAKRKWNDFLKEIDTDFKKTYKDLKIDNKYTKSNFETYKTDIKTTQKAIKDTEKEINRLNDLQNKIKKEKGRKLTVEDIIEDAKVNGAYKFSSIEEAQEELKKLQDQLLDQGKSLNQAYQQLWDNYLEGIDQVNDKLDDLMKQYEKINDELEYQKELIELLYGDEAYDLMNKYYKAQEKNNLAEINSLKQQVDFYNNEFKKAYKKAHKKDSTVDKNDMTTWTADMKKYYDAAQDAQDKLNSKVLEGIKLLTEDYNNAYKKAKKQMEEGLFGEGNDYNKVKEEWDYIQKKSSEYLDDVEGAYRIQTLANKINKSISETSSLKAQQKLQALRESEIKTLRQKENLTQSDIELAEARYQIALKEIALEDAQNNKTAMKLVRDASGNWTYQYTADEEDMANKQQDLLDAYNNLYTTADNAYAHSIEYAMELTQQYYAKMDELRERQRLYNEDVTDEMTKLTEQWEADMTTIFGNAELYKQEAIGATAGLFTAACNQGYEDYQGLTDSWKTMTDGVKENGLSSYEEIRKAIVENGIPELKTITENYFKSFNQNCNNSAANAQLKWVTAKDSIMAVVNKAFDSMDAALADYNQGLTDLEKAADQKFGEEGISGAIQGAIDKTNELNGATEELLKDSQSYLAELRNDVYSIQAAWEGVIASIRTAQQEIIDYLNLMSNMAEQQNQQQQPNTTPTGTPEGNSPSSNGNEGGSPSSNPGGGNGGGNGNNKYEVYDSYHGGIEITDSDWKRRIYNMSEEERKRKGYSIVHLASGGYTGSWDDTGRLAVLHQKELVLNQDDTANMLQAVSIIRDMAKLNDSINSAIASSIGAMAMNIVANSGNGINPANNNNTSNQFNITAEFPNANDVSAIREAILSLPNLAAQYIHSNN